LATPYALQLPEDESLKPRTVDFLFVIAVCSLHLCCFGVVLGISRVVIVELAVQGFVNLKLNIECFMS
jgi:hypothetical protein